MRKLLIAAALVASSVANAQQAKVASKNVSGAIAATNTFQTIFETGPRTGCSIQNTGANNMWVFFGPVSSATKAKSVVLQPYAMVSCNVAGATITDEINITGTATDTFFAAVQ